MRPSIAVASLVVLIGTHLASAPQSKAAGLVAASDPGGNVVVRDGESTVASFLPKTEAKLRGPATVRQTQVSGHTVVEVGIPIAGESGRRSEVWIAERAGGSAKVIWWDFVGANDPDGESSTVVEVADGGIQVYQTAARLSRCDGVPVRLSTKTWDFASHAFKAASPSLPGKSATTVQARRGAAPDGKPLGGFFFSAASTSPGASAEPSRLKPPAAVNDGSPATVWATEGDARGHLLTARSSGGFAITGLRLLPGDPSTDRSFRASSRPRKLALIFGKKPTDTVDVDLIEDADGGVGRSKIPFWIALPKPVATACVTVLVREATSDRVPMSIADLEVMTELDGPEAADRLVESLAQGKSCEARQPLLLRLGQPALAKVAAAVVKAPAGAGRGCLVEALAALLASGATASPEVGDALAAAIEGASATEEKIILKLLPGLPAPPIAAVAAILQNAKRAEADRLRAARVLAAISNEEATKAVVSALGQGDQPMRRSLRAVAVTLKAPAASAAKAALDATAATDVGRRADLLLVFASLAAREPSAGADALASLNAALAAPASFEEQARAIAGLGALKDPAALAKLVDVRAHSTDGVLRSFAMAEIAAWDAPSTLPALRAALEDADPRVRETAASALGQRRDKGSAELLIAGAKQEPWPGVRRAQVAALGELCTPAGNELIQRALKKDIDDVRQVALVGLAHCYGAKANPALLQILGRLPESADMRSQAARLLAEHKDPSTVHGMAEALVRLVRESEADLSLHTVIVDTAMALATIRTPEAISALVGLISERDVSVQRAGIDALGVVCDPGPGAAALRAAAQSKDEAVSIPAAAAALRCRDRR